MLRFSTWTRSAAAFFRSAIFTSFFCGERHVRVIAWGGAILLGSIAITNALTAFYLASLIRTVGDMQKRGASYEEVSTFILPFACVFFWLFVIEPKSELLRNYFSAYWAKTTSRWFSDTWIMDHLRLTFGKAPDGISQIIVDRPLALTIDLVNLFVPLCRSFVIVLSFGYMTWCLSADLFPTVAHYVPGWLCFLVVGWSLMEGLMSYRLGRPLPGTLDGSFKLRAKYRTRIEDSEKLMRAPRTLRLCERIKLRDEARKKLDVWFGAYLQTFKPNLKLLTWKSGNQQSWQFILIAILPLMTASDVFSIGTAAAAVYAINEMRGALLTLPNQWLVVVNIQAQVLGLRELEDTICPVALEPVGAVVLAPAE